jgi:hypothetical protein
MGVRGKLNSRIMKKGARGIETGPFGKPSSLKRLERSAKRRKEDLQGNSGVLELE